MKILGKFLFYTLWPLVWIYAPLTRRVRVVAISNGKILVVKNWFGSGRWQLPGGGIKIGETIIDAACRELEEELHIAALNPVLLHAEPKIIKQTGLLMRYHFLAVDISDKKILKKERQITDVMWQDINSLNGVAQEVLTGLDLVSQQR